MSHLYIKRKSVFIAGTALLGATVAVLDWAFKIAGLKDIFRFPLLPFLKFDLMGIPMFLAYLLFGFLSGTIASLIAFLSISFRDPFSGFMKFLAEFATIAGVYIVLRTKKPSSMKQKLLAMLSGIILRVVVMDIANVSLLPIFTPYFKTPMAVIIILHWFSLFNAIQGTVSVFGGFLLYEAVVMRLPFLKSNDKLPKALSLSTNGPREKIVTQLRNFKNFFS